MTTTTDVQFAPDPEVKVHEEGAIRLICAQFRSHEAGLPEWFKNASDMYIRVSAPQDDAVILGLFRDGERARHSAIGCLDFGGMTTADIEGKFRNWADPEAAGRAGSDQVEGGHGNGGKCYMTQMFDHYAYVHTLKDGRGSRYGFVAGRVVPGYFPTALAGRGYVVTDPDKELNSALSNFDLSISKLPEAARSAWARRKSFTLVVGFGAKHCAKRLPLKALIEGLQNHQQMVQALQRNKIFCLHNGGLLPGAAPLSLEDIKPIAGAEDPRVIPVPKTLVDPNTMEDVATGAVEGKSLLMFRTSDVSMRYSLKARHTINGWTHARRTTGFWEIPELSRSSYASKIYGDLSLDALDQYKQNDRRHHSPSPLIRALTNWLSEEIEKYAAEFVKLEQLQASQEERNELSTMNRALNDWKNTFLQEEFGGIGAGADGGRGGRRRYKLPIGVPARVTISLTHQFSGCGISFQPSVDFYDADNRHIRSAPHTWECSDWAVATVDDRLGTITTRAPGKVTLKVVCKDIGVSSDPVSVEVLDLTQVAIDPEKITIKEGGCERLTAKVKTSDGRDLEGAYLVWTESNGEIISVGSGGMVYGLKQGQGEVFAGDNKVLSERPSVVVVQERKPEDKGGDGFPKILLSEIDDDPMGGPPPAFSAAEPPIHQRPQDVDNNVWWINMASPLARRYLDTARQGGARSKEWRVYLLERYVEVMVRIMLQYDFEHGEEITFETMLRRWDEESVLMQQRAMDSLQGFLDEGEIPVSINA